MKHIKEFNISPDSPHSIESLLSARSNSVMTETGNIRMPRSEWLSLCDNFIEAFTQFAPNEPIESLEQDITKRSLRFYNGLGDIVPIIEGIGIRNIPKWGALNEAYLAAEVIRRFSKSTEVSALRDNYDQLMDLLWDGPGLQLRDAIAIGDYDSRLAAAILSLITRCVYQNVKLTLDLGISLNERNSLEIAIPRSALRNYRRQRYVARFFDTRNLLTYGWLAPVYAERLWVNPQLCADSCLPGRGEVARASASILEAWPPKKTRPVLTNPTVRICVDHWVNGKSWEEAGEYKRSLNAIERKGSDGGCKTLADVIAKCKRLDDIFLETAQRGMFRTSSEIEPASFRETNSVMVHVGPDGELLLGEGTHRIAIAFILGLRMIPAKVGFVHSSVIPFLPWLRRRPSDVSIGAASVY